MNKVVLTLALIAVPAFAQGQDDAARAQASATVLAKHKHPKLSTQLADLRRAASQRSQPPAPGEKIEIPPHFDVETLPDSIRDAVRAGQMHITTDAAVQVYIEVGELTAGNPGSLEAIGG